MSRLMSLKVSFEKNVSRYNCIFLNLGIRVVLQNKLMRDISIK